MTSWLDDFKTWLPVAAIVAQAAITWSKVSAQEQRILAIEEDIDSLREWRAQARERIANLLRKVDGHREEDEGAE